MTSGSHNSKAQAQVTTSPDNSHQETVIQPDNHSPSSPSIRSGSLEALAQQSLSGCHQSSPTSDSQVRDRYILDRNSNSLRAANGFMSGASPPRLRVPCDDCRRAEKKCSQLCDTGHEFKRIPNERGKVYETRRKVGKVSVTEDAVNQDLTRKFSDDEWNDIFKKSEPGNDLASSPTEAPIVHTGYPQETLGEHLSSSPERTLGNMDLRGLDILDPNASEWLRCEYPQCLNRRFGTDAILLQHQREAHGFQRFPC